ncbi:MAG: hypothetical protein U9R32_10085 [Bacteroidota bacterium]|nr:hypothetical protein [Bacteroidota bacterium]
MIKLFLLTLVLVFIAVLLMGIKVLFFKNQKFPETQIGHNKVMKKRKIYCPKTLDAIERKNCDSCSITD